MQQRPALHMLFLVLCQRTGQRCVWLQAGGDSVARAVALAAAAKDGAAVAVVVQHLQVGLSAHGHVCVTGR